MKTPVFDFLKEYADSGILRAHMPGHKGKGALGFEKYDITEVCGADVLYSPNGIIKESQQNASLLFDTALTMYSAEGSSLSIRAMLFLLKRYCKIKNKPCNILAGRNAHSSFVSAAAVLGIDVSWIYPEKNGVLSCNITPEKLEAELEKGLYSALYVTSPDYLGNILDIKGLSSVCKRFGVLLFVDNAHGAYLKFLPNDLHPITLGADICCDSAHKTLPVLTGGGYLHISKNADTFFENNALNAMKTFASTSPSYLTLMSLDKANEYIALYIKKDLEEAVLSVQKLKDDLPIEVTGNEPLKITLTPKSYGYTGEEISEILRQNNIETEFSDKDFCVLMLSPQNITDMPKIKKVLSQIPKRKEITLTAPKFTPPKKVMSLNEAVFSESVRINVKDCVDKTLSCAAVNCPPAVSVAVCGEQINQSIKELFEYYGITEIDVVKS